MALIFIGSTDLLSSRHTWLMLVALLRWLSPGIRESTLNKVHMLIRKTGHLIEYALLAWLIWRGLKQPVEDEHRAWSWRDALRAWAFTVAYAVTDEIHQAMVTTRHGSVIDALIDAGGAGLGLSVVWLVGRSRRRW
jgi:VanZ family protein